MKCLQKNGYASVGWGLGVCVCVCVCPCVCRAESGSTSLDVSLRMVGWLSWRLNNVVRLKLESKAAGYCSIYY